ncbi:M15 family metallopeptidase [Polyangium aurulentum]|uniref:M15 family metallopeptidase n=1 Tax=Polyangium aurulentum TaxID=2567896 RepID=UPI001469C4DA|nr:M15 family metallopeptidase [Polyangium aurulentum]UQA56121.1 M15 family metallopeptidase [Polyangium aurulentum]
MDATLILRRFALLATLAAAPFAGAGCLSETPEELDDGELEGIEAPEPVDQVDEAATSTTVSGAVSASCSTSSVKGLSLQIINEARCMNGDAYVQVPKLANVTFGSAVFPYLEKPAKDALVAALKANPSRSMTINSGLRTVAQQYLLYRWYQQGRCGIGLAAKPGSSNHETGLALDISQYSAWKSSLTSRGFKWLGSGDPVHFDYAGSGAVSHKGLDVKAFQRLWNRNHPEDKIDTDGVWGPQTEARMKKSPTKGFAKGPTCGLAITTPDADSASVETMEDFVQGIPLDQIQEEAIEETCSDHDHEAGEHIEQIEQIAE